MIVLINHMYQYPKIEDESILLDKDCKRLLRRTSRKHIIEEVLNKLDDIDDKDYKDDKDDKDDTSLEKELNNNSNKFHIYSFILQIFGCNKDI